MQPNNIPNNTNVTEIINETLKITPEITKSIDSVVKTITKLTDNMLECRKQAIKQINEKYGLNITVELSSVWKMQKQSVDDLLNLPSLRRCNIVHRFTSAVDAADVRNIYAHRVVTFHTIANLVNRKQDMMSAA